MNDGGNHGDMVPVFLVWFAAVEPFFKNYDKKNLSRHLSRHLGGGINGGIFTCCP